MRKSDDSKSGTRTTSQPEIGPQEGAQAVNPDGTPTDRVDGATVNPSAPTEPAPMDPAVNPRGDAR